MSVNKVNKSNGQLIALASGNRMWVGTHAAHLEAIANGTMPNNCIVAETDGFESSNVIKIVDTMPSNPSVGNVVCWNGLEEINTVYLKTTDPSSVTRLCDANGNIITNPSGTLTSEVTTVTSYTDEDDWYFMLSYDSNYSNKITVVSESPNGNWYYWGLVCNFSNLTWSQGSRLGDYYGDFGMRSASFVTYTVNAGNPYIKGHLYRWNGSSWVDAYS